MNLTKAEASILILALKYALNATRYEYSTAVKAEQKQHAEQAEIMHAVFKVFLDKIQRSFIA